MVRGRLAPSPTGYLHIGNARSFLLAWLHVRSLGGEIVLRIEDLDTARAVHGAATEIVHDLNWLGLDWDNQLEATYIQSNRFDRYRGALEELQSRDLVYPCYCSRRELREIASAPHGPSGPLYPGTCRNLTPAERLEREVNKTPSWRFRVQPETIVEFDDLIAGTVRERIDRRSGDFIVARADGIFSYQLAVVIDDIDMGITHVLRGDDLLDSTPRQILLFNTFGATPPRYAHVPLILGPDGVRLAKRHGSISIAELRSAGHSPEQLIGWLAWSCGLLPHPEPIAAGELVAEFSLDRVDREVTRLASLDIMNGSS